MSKNEMLRKAPIHGDILYAYLEIWQAGMSFVNSIIIVGYTYYVQWKMEPRLAGSPKNRANASAGSPRLEPAPKELVNFLLKIHKLRQVTKNTMKLKPTTHKVNNKF